MRKPIPKNRRPKLDLVAEYKNLSQKQKLTEARMAEIKSIVIDKGGSLKTESGSLMIEKAERRQAPSLQVLEETGFLAKLESAGLIKRIEVQILRVFKKEAA